MNHNWLADSVPSFLDSNLIVINSINKTNFCSKTTHKLLGKLNYSLWGCNFAVLCYLYLISGSIATNNQQGTSHNLVSYIFSQWNNIILQNFIKIKQDKLPANIKFTENLFLNRILLYSNETSILNHFIYLEKETSFFALHYTNTILMTMTSGRCSSTAHTPKPKFFNEQVSSPPPNPPSRANSNTFNWKPSAQRMWRYYQRRMVNQGNENFSGSSYLKEVYLRTKTMVANSSKEIK